MEDTGWRRGLRTESGYSSPNSALEAQLTTDGNEIAVSRVAGSQWLKDEGLWAELSPSELERPLGLGFGCAAAAPLLWLCMYALSTGRTIQEAYVAYAVSERTPLLVLCAIVSAGVICLFAALASLSA